MTFEEELEDSLQACQELKQFMHTEEDVELDVNKLSDILNEFTTKSEEVEPIPEPIPNPEPEPIQEPVSVQESEPILADESEPMKEPALAQEPEQASRSDLVLEEQQEERQEEQAEAIVEFIDPDEEEATKGKKAFNIILDILLCVGIAFILSFLITHYVAHHTTVEGNSMNPTVANGDQLIVEKISYYMHDPERFDMIVFPYSDGVYYIKRVIGLPGETIQIKDGKVYINDKELTSDVYGKGLMEDAGMAAEPITLGKEEYFVLGDNRNQSIDSRKTEVGVIKKNKISGRAWMRIYPFSEICFLKHAQ